MLADQRTEKGGKREGRYGRRPTRRLRPRRVHLIPVWWRLLSCSIRW